MIPSGLARATAGTISRKIAAFFRTRSSRVSPGFWAAPAEMTVIAAPAQSAIGAGPDPRRPRERDRVHEVHRLALGLAGVGVDEDDLGREAREEEAEREGRADGAGADDGDPRRMGRGAGLGRALGLGRGTGRLAHDAIVPHPARVPIRNLRGTEPVTRRGPPHAVARLPSLHPAGGGRPGRRRGRTVG